MASNILLLASKHFFLTSQLQGLVGAGMNCRALIHMNKSVFLTIQKMHHSKKEYIGETSNVLNTNQSNNLNKVHIIFV